MKLSQLKMNLMRHAQEYACLISEGWLESSTQVDIIGTFTTRFRHARNGNKLILFTSSAIQYQIKNGVMKKSMTFPENDEE